MKKTTFGMMAFAVLLACFLIGCPNDPDDAGDTNEPDTKKSMTFHSDSAEPPKREFTIYDDLSFSVTFVNLEGLEAEDAAFYVSIGIEPGVVITGSIDTNNSWTSSPLTGTAKNLKADTPPGGMLDILANIPGIGIKLTYGQTNNNITSVDVEINGNGVPSELLSIVPLANELMGGTFYIKP